MEFQPTTLPPHQQKTDCIVLGIFEDGLLPVASMTFDEGLGGYLTKFMTQGDFKGESGETLLHHHTHPDLAATRVLLVGCGKKGEFSAAQYTKAMNASFAGLKKLNSRTVSHYLTAMPIEGIEASWTMKQAIVSFGQQTYVFDNFKSKKQDPIKLEIAFLCVPEGMEEEAAKAAIEQGQAMQLGMATCKALGDLPANHCTPTQLAEYATKLANQYKPIKSTILDEKAMAKLNMHAILSVSRGSVEPAKFIILEYKGAEDTNAAPYVLIGKGVTFDAGGISIKGSASMDEMKYDMCGAASVLGTLQAVAELALPINVIVLVPATENLPSGQATKPGDVITGMSGQSIEILNTDAEGRLILSDALTYAEKFNPKTVIDVATLTMAMIIGLGHDISGIFANDQALADALLTASKQTQDTVWQMPLWEGYQKQLESRFADMANIGGRTAGSITAACFLSRFAKAFPWVHIDIAGTAWQSDKNKGATGRPVPLLTQYLINAASAEGA